MENILYQLYSGDYDITPERSKKQQEARKQILTELGKVEEAFGEEFLNHLLDLDGAHEDQKNFSYFRSGFLTGARLMLEVLEA